ncbi:MAG: glucose-1-phosphate thymidylyltransferase [Flammeovirgaceae bacterium]|nr:glucose-1-phosphate thymidylyltransferase [Flammeovirgaceae bacterium]MBE61770.1 glucose-1-phosphate thymidylyltransferase [Flammeovirgaceae bacterium]MBR08842.1 glucose-1-phosphate thymidylyltransferase [Rickettsiales bacterium]HCX22585.1 glucose-1-phosphate thymidylyltransferase [Cytophagales bacterium]|tara:strand:- start:2378 stop:3574 length:1197 start_codon:yes stop_codon:yes gene_type:complete
MNILFAETQEGHQKLLPLTYTRPISNLRVGILTIDQKWAKYLKAESFGYLTEEYLQQKFTPVQPSNDTIWVINGALPSSVLIDAIHSLKTGEAITQAGQLIIAKGIENPIANSPAYQTKELDLEINQVNYTWDIFRLNGQEIRSDYELITAGRTSAEITDPHTIVYAKENIFLEEGVTIKAAILNAENGPIYIGKDCEIQEGAVIRGPFAMGEHSTVAMGTKLRGDTSAGPYCKLGGEISNSVFWGYSNKGHDGFLGNSVIGEWCNFGAGTNNSNLKNNYDPVRMWDFGSQSFAHTGLQFCGLIMGDHSKTAIGTLFNTGTTVGVAANIYGNGFPRTIIPSFAWGGSEGFVTHHPRKACITADIVMKRRNLELTQEDKDILNHIFEASSQYRVWEKKD